MTESNSLNSHRRLFYNNFGGIFGLAVVGTCVSIAVVAVGLHLLAPLIVSSADSWSLIECVCFASLISSTDPVRSVIRYALFLIYSTHL